MNKAIITGRLGDDAQLMQGQSGPWCKMRIATDDSYTDRQGNKVERTDWHSIVAFGKLAEVCAKFLGKGSLVGIDGSVHYRTYEKDGQTRYVTEIKASQVRFYDTKTPASQSAGQQNDQPQHDTYHHDPGYAGGMDDIPF